MPRRWYQILRPKLTNGLEANFHPYGRKTSILLDEVNPVIHPGEFVLPRLPRRLLGCKRTGYNAENRNLVTEPSRSSDEVSMGAYEGSMYMRMLTSPLRKCILTSQLTPSDFLIRLGLPKSPESGSKSRRNTKTKKKWDGVTAIPDGLEHPRFAPRNCSVAFYIPCWRGALDAVKEAGHQYRSSIASSSTLSEQISLQLQRRVVQEAQLLSLRLVHAQEGSQLHPALRRLTRREWMHMANIGSTEEANPLAILTFESTTSSKNLSHAPSTPISLINKTRHEDSSSIPLYNTLQLFTSPAERLSFKQALNTILGVEYKTRYKIRTSLQAPSPNIVRSNEADPLDRASHAYLLNGSQGTLNRIDTIPLAVALWRLKMWEHGTQLQTEQTRW
ncbi:hypothetical protein FRC03_005685 [Tulasnella sp. 419]|nr:hypothetical protein FRC03_005685 [Tulasnella sp. 419]